MKKLYDFIRWANFLVTIKENITSLKETVKTQDELIAKLEKQNMLLLGMSNNQRDTIDKLEVRIGRLEENAMGINSLTVVQAKQINSDGNNRKKLKQKMES